MRRPGTFREVVTVFTQQRTASDEHGQRASDLYTEAGTERAEVETERGGDERTAGTERPRERILVRLRAPTDITNTSEIEWRGTRYEVTSVQRTGTRKRFVDVTAVNA